MPLHSLINHLLNPTQAKIQRNTHKGNLLYSCSFYKKRRGLLCYPSPPFYFFLKPPKKQLSFLCSFPRQEKTRLFILLLMLKIRENQVFAPSLIPENGQTCLFLLCSFFKPQWPTIFFLSSWVLIGKRSAPTWLPAWLVEWSVWCVVAWVLQE